MVALAQRSAWPVQLSQDSAGGHDRGAGGAQAV